MAHTTTSSSLESVGADGVPNPVPVASSPRRLNLSENEGSHHELALPWEALASHLHRYPEVSDLGATLASVHGVAAGRVLVTAGADDAIDRLCRVVLGPGRSMVLPSPTFDRIPRYAAMAGAVVFGVPWVDGAFPIEGYLEHVGARPAIVGVISPNNPTGTVATADDLERLSHAFRDSVILLDHAYVEYADADLTPMACAFPNVVVTRTMSKAWGLAGLRVGYALGPAQVLAAMREAGPVYPVSGLSAAVARVVRSTCGESMRRHVERVRRERGELALVMRGLGFRVPESQANCVCACHPAAEAIHAALAARGVMVKRLDPASPQGPSLRIGCPANEEDFAFLMGVMREVMAAVAP